MEPAELARRLLDRDRSAVPQALNCIEDQRPEQRARAAALLAQIEGKATQAWRVGITGAPGAGKSTLIDLLVRRLREQGRSIGIIAVDPSSQKTGGALLGDRFRLGSGARDAGVFLRSMAARDQLGGLAEATREGVEVLAAAFDVVFVETVGVGQSETDVSNLVDTLIFVAQPGAGDSIQFMKAGILEMPDIFVVNKSDLGPEAERSLHELSAALGLDASASSSVAPGTPDEWRPVSLAASAQDGVGAEAILDAIAAHRTHLDQQGRLAERRARGRDAHMLAVLTQRYGVFGIDKLGGRRVLIGRLRGMQSQTMPAVLQQLGDEIEARLREG